MRKNLLAVRNKIKTMLVFTALYIALSAGAYPALAQTTGPFHPMDALTIREVNEAVGMLKATGHVDAKTRYADVRLEEMAKPQMLAWKRGMPFSRTAFVIYRKQAKTYEALIDLTGKKVISVTHKAGMQPSILQEEWDRARKLTRADKRWLAAIARRKLDLKKVFCAPFGFGYFGEKKYQGRRLMRVPCSVSHAPTKDRIESLYRHYGIPIEGLYAVVDVDKNQVIDVVDTIAVTPAKIWDKPSESALAKERSLLKPVLLLSPQGANFKLSGGIQVQWQKWSFHLRAERRSGPVISLVRYKDAGRNRLIAYQMALSEMFVPYMSADNNWNYRNYMDAGEYGIGYLASTLSPGRDCPLQSAYISVYIPSDKGSVFRVKRGICIFERNVGDPLWRHENLATQRTESRPAVELVVRMATVIGNYDYLIDWVFYQDGNIKGRIGAAGIVAVKTVKRGSAAADPNQLKGSQKPENGTLVSPGMLAVYHDHYFSFRLDLDVEGQENTLIRERVVPKILAKGNQRRSIWTLEKKPVTREGPVRGGREIWRVVNPHGKTRLGHKPSYHLMPGMTVTSLLSPDDFPQKRAGFSAEKLWVTAFNKREKYAAGDYPNQHPGGAGLPSFVADKQNIESKDIVLWYTMGFHHITRVEDWPMMPTMWHEFTLRPFNFFDENPAINVAPSFLRPVREAPSKPGVPVLPKPK